MACCLYQGCQEEPEISDIGEIVVDGDGNNNGNNNGNSNGNSNGIPNSEEVKQVDIKVVIPVHPSSLKYFDYNIIYSDNTGEEYRDTIREGQIQDGADIYYVKNLVYKKLPLICRCEVTLVPKVSRDSVVSFSYTIPKPSIFSRVIFNSHSYTPETGSNDIEGVEVLNLDEIRIGTFLSTYGSWFCSTCSVKKDYDGVNINFY